jgi:hypothetical protein
MMTTIEPVFPLLPEDAAEPTPILLERVMNLVDLGYGK